MSHHEPFVPEKTELGEFSLRAILLGVLMAVILGAANAYVGLKAGMTVAATFPAAVVAMALLKPIGGSILEENIARTAASVGEALVAGAIFTIPAFYISGSWDTFATWPHYLEASVIMLVGGLLGVLFISILRKVMVEEASLPFPESVAAAEIHKAGRTGGTGALYLFGAALVGGIVQLLAKMNVFKQGWEHFIPFGKSGINLKIGDKLVQIGGRAGFPFTSFAISPALFGVGYIIGPRLSCIAFSGGLLAWGLFVPLLLFLHAHSFVDITASPDNWMSVAWSVWKQIVRPLAVGGMLGGAAYTLYKMRKQLSSGLGRALGDLTKAAHQTSVVSRFDKDLNFKFIFFLIGITFLGMIAVYNYFIGDLKGAIAAAVIMVIAGFFFSAVAGHLVGLIGSSNNPISGLTLSTLIVAALVMLALGVTGKSGVSGVLGVAAVVCCLCGIAGDMTQDLKVGYILGGTPWKMELAEILGVIASAFVMFGPLVLLYKYGMMREGIGFGGKEIPAPQASLMAMISKGILEGEMAWPLVIAGIFMTIGLILIQAPSPMLISVGMYLPLETTFAIFIGGVIKWVTDLIVKGRRLSDTEKVSVENKGTLVASGFIAGEALIGLIIAALYVGSQKYPWMQLPEVFKNPSFGLGLLVAFILALILIFVPLKGRKEQGGA